MAGQKFLSNLDAEALYRAAFRRAQDMGYTVREVGERAFSAKSGNVLTKILMASHCDFRIDIETYPDGNELVLERNTPMFAGALVRGRIKGLATNLMQSIKDDVVAAGGKILRESEF